MMLKGEAKSEEPPELDNILDQLQSNPQLKTALITHLKNEGSLNTTQIYKK